MSTASTGFHQTEVELAFIAQVQALAAYLQACDHEQTAWSRMWNRAATSNARAAREVAEEHRRLARAASRAYTVIVAC